VRNHEYSAQNIPDRDDVDDWPGLWLIEDDVVPVGEKSPA
jgi:hypothetical protein